VHQNNLGALYEMSYLIIAIAVGLLLWGLFLLLTSSRGEETEAFDGGPWDLTDETLHGNEVRVKEEFALLNVLIAKVNAMVSFIGRNVVDDARVEVLRSSWKGRVYRLDPNSTKEAAVTLDKTEIRMCLRDKETGRLHTANEAMFVLVHELAHLVTVTVGHTNEFWNNMRWLLKFAESAVDDRGIPVYVDQDFENNPVTYCGHSITGSPLTCVKNNLCAYH
jgi:hypothetical protein